MLIKLVPEDFRVEELTEWQPAESGPFSVYELTKRKLDTFEAMRLVSAHARVPLQKIAYVGLKDRQGVTTQLISIEGGRLDGRISGIKYRFLGRARAPLGPEHLRGNAFTIVVRDLGDDDVALLPERRARLERHGLVAYFDDQRFGSLVAGQGLPGRDLVRGDHEAVVRALIATPGRRDPLPEKKFKVLVSKAWGDWELILKKWGTRKGVSMIQHLRRRPGDFTGALQKLPAKERAIHVFAYQSLIWNRSVALYLERKLPRSKLARTRYVGGELVWPDLRPDEEAPPLVESFPLLDHQVRPDDPEVRAAIDAALAEEGLTLERFRIDGIPGCFFKHHERPLRVWPAKLKLGKPEPDDRRPGRLKVWLSFELPPGAYATLVLLRLFGAQAREADRERTRRRKPAGASASGRDASDDGDLPVGARHASPVLDDDVSGEGSAEVATAKRRSSPRRERRGGGEAGKPRRGGRGDGGERREGASSRRGDGRGQGGDRREDTSSRGRDRGDRQQGPGARREGGPSRPGRHGDDRPSGRGAGREGGPSRPGRQGDDRPSGRGARREGGPSRPGRHGDARPSGRGAGREDAPARRGKKGRARGGRGSRGPT